MADGFWDVIEAQLATLRKAQTADDVMAACPKDGHMADGRSGGFFAGGGGDETVEDALFDAGWRHVWRDAWYYFAMRAPGGDVITYVEGDLYRGDQKVRATHNHPPGHLRRPT